MSPWIVTTRDRFLAHRVILSVLSLFFRDILNKHKHQNLFINRRGIKSNDPNALLDFIYRGKVNIYLKAIAEKLVLTGWRGTSSEEMVQYLAQHIQKRTQKENHWRHSYHWWTTRIQTWGAKAYLFWRCLYGWQIAGWANKNVNDREKGRNLDL